MLKVQSLTEKQKQLGNNNNNYDVMIVTLQIWRNKTTKTLKVITGHKTVLQRLNYVGFLYNKLCTK